MEEVTIILVLIIEVMPVTYHGTPLPVTPVITILVEEGPSILVEIWVAAPLILEVRKMKMKTSSIPFST